MARDILAVPISGVGVERTFNMARDVCHYRRGQLGFSTIQKVMIIKHRRRAHLDPQYEPDSLLDEPAKEDTGEEGVSSSQTMETNGVEDEVIVDGIDDDLLDDNHHVYDFVDLQEDAES
jgi:hypothetical protein